jgi:hypothetical protein
MECKPVDCSGARQYVTVTVNMSLYEPTLAVAWPEGMRPYMVDGWVAPPDVAVIFPEITLVPELPSPQIVVRVLSI